jgi:hypothetical protein
VAEATACWLKRHPVAIDSVIGRHPAQRQHLIAGSWRSRTPPPAHRHRPAAAVPMSRSGVRGRVYRWRSDDRGLVSRVEKQSVRMVPRGDGSRTMLGSWLLDNSVKSHHSIALASFEKTAFGSRSCLGANWIAKKSACLVSTLCGDRHIKLDIFGCNEQFRLKKAGSGPSGLNNFVTSERLL